MSNWSATGTLEDFHFFNRERDWIRGNSAVGVDGSFATIFEKRTTGARQAILRRFSPTGLAYPDVAIDNLGSGYFHNKPSCIWALPTGGFAFGGYSTNAAGDSVPWVAVTNTAGSLAWQRILTEYPPTRDINSVVKVFDGPSNSITAVVQTSGGQRCLSRFSSTGAPIGFRGGLDFLSADGIFKVGSRIAFFQVMTTSAQVRMYNLDGVRTYTATIPFPPGMGQFFEKINIALIGDDIYGALTQSDFYFGTFLFRVDAVGNVRWTTTSPYVRGYTNEVLTRGSQIEWVVRGTDPANDAQVLSVNAYGEKTGVAGSRANFVASDEVGPIALADGQYVGLNPTDLSERFRVTSFESNLVQHGLNGQWYELERTGRVYDYGLTSLPQSAPWTIVSYIQAPYARPDDFKGQLNTLMSRASTAGTFVNDSFVTGAVSTVVTGPTRGTLRMFSAGDFEYTPNTGFAGTDAFTYRASRAGLSRTAVATLRVLAPGDIDLWITKTNPKLITKGTSVTLKIGLQPSLSTTRIFFTSSSPSVTVPAFVDVPANASVVSVTASSPSTASLATATITARSANFTQATTLQVVDCQVASVTVGAGPLRPGGSVPVTVTLDVFAPSAVSAAVLSDAPLLVNVPATVSFLTGERTRTFNVTLRATPTGATSVSVAARRGPSGAGGTLSIAP